MPAGDEMPPARAVADTAAPDFGSPVDAAFDDLLRSGRSAASRGRAAAALGQHQAAVRSLSSAVRYLAAARAPPPEEASALCARASALVALARCLRARPAAQSERAALFGQDPTVLADLALKDARRAALLLPPPAGPGAGAGGDGDDDRDGRDQDVPDDGDGDDGDGRDQGAAGEAKAASAAAAAAAAAAGAALLASAARAEGDALFLLERFPDAEAAYLEALALSPAGDSDAATAAAEGLAKTRRELGEGDEDAGAGDQQRGGGLGAPARGVGAAAAAATAAADPLQRGAGGGASSLPQAAAALAARRGRRGRLARDLDEADCALCAQLLLEPTTTPCGHSFCRACLSRALDFAPRCPACRAVLHTATAASAAGEGGLAVSVTLRALLSASYPREYARREREAAEQQAAAAAAASGAAGAARPGQRQRARVTMPLFVMTALVVGERMALNIFEPRYRLLIRRCLEGSRRLGTAQGASHSFSPPAGGGRGEDGGGQDDDDGDGQEDDDDAPLDGLDRFCCEAEIVECAAQPDGRYHVELVGRRVVRIDALSETDGYRVATGTVVGGGGGAGGIGAGGAPEEGEGAEERRRAAAAAAAAELAARAARVSALADAWLSRLRVAFAGRGAAARLVDVLERVGRKPALRPPTRDAAEAAAAAAAAAAASPVAAGDQQQQPQQQGAPLAPPPLAADAAAIIHADAEAVSWWAARLLVTTAAAGEHAERAALLRARGAARRLRLEERGLEARLASTSGCAVM